MRIDFFISFSPFVLCLIVQIKFNVIYSEAVIVSYDLDICFEAVFSYLYYVFDLVARALDLAVIE
ncbi:MAG: hypothetical protein IKM18_06590 [Clostridia bacterium]|nr:hypothetical protein [Clostridia bacterium]